VDEISGAFLLETVPTLLETAGDPGLRILLPGKDENRVPAFATQWHPVGERSLPRGPSDVYP
jgi:hypothetical protein